MGADEDYIDMEITSSSSSSSSSPSSNLFSIINSPPQNREFEFQFQMSTPPTTTTTTTTTDLHHHNKQHSIFSPADELFFKGKLLPLHLPPRLQMVQILSTTTAPCTTSHTPMESCNISPTESCRPSCELNPDDYFFEWSSELNGFFTGDNNNTNTNKLIHKKSWTAISKKIRLLKQSSFGQRLMSSRSYFKSLFTTRSISSSSSVEKPISVDSKIIKKNPFLQIGKSTFPISVEAITTHRKSFSGAIKRHSPTKCLSSSFSSTDSSSSSSSNSSSSSISIRSMGFHELQLLKRSCSANSELESSIEGAIAHCKKSQHHFNSMTAVSEDKER
ncbi:probable membrane-associated kinase regulator 3 [Impatiens glandulifera]|uniref:probable membrane-associated kinase regulator 3 n=1 Tax=Impatiens glandulifera TaxID=253017 RepID=UPI001FB08964|nr:probable membrane-associated kinase regulator 3 [Impatiens glandulifera]